MIGERAAVLHYLDVVRYEVLRNVVVPNAELQPNTARGGIDELLKVSCDGFRPAKHVDKVDGVTDFGERAEDTLSE